MSAVSRAPSTTDCEDFGDCPSPAAILPGSSFSLLRGSLNRGATILSAIGPQSTPVALLAARGVAKPCAMSATSETGTLKVASDWNKNAQQWAADLQAGRDRIRDLFTFPAFCTSLPPVAGLKLMDFGCGEGCNTRRLAELGADMTGIDLAEQMIAHAREAEAIHPLGIDYVVGSFTARLPFPDGSFDGVVSTMAFMDGPDFAGAMREAFRIVRPGGFVAFSVLHPCFVGRRLHWAKDQAGRTAGLVVSQYFDREGYTDSWSFRSGTAAPNFSVPRFPRTISEYLNGVALAGLHIVRLEEPQPSADACAKLPSLARWREHAALMLVVVAERPR